MSHPSFLNHDTVIQQQPRQQICDGGFLAFLAFSLLPYCIENQQIDNVFVYQHSGEDLLWGEQQGCRCELQLVVLFKLTTDATTTTRFGFYFPKY
jgi:hypothetical protein